MTEERFSKLCNVWSKIGPFDMDLFSHRLILQKKIFLLQEAGYDLGYNFGRYLRGPYSSALATDGYKIKASENISGGDGCSDEGIKVISEIEEGHKNDAGWFELVATIVYLVKKEKKTKEEVISFILENKPHIYNLDRINEAFSKLENLKILG